MEFKIDTKENYTVLTPIVADLDANLTEAISQKWKNFTESGSKNLIVDLVHCQYLPDDAVQALLGLHEQFYGAEQSLVFTNIPEQLLQKIKNKDEDRILNLAPSFAEAVDIVSMELLERDLFNEE